jgi:hypothetical protein
MAGWAMDFQKNETTKTMPIAPVFKTVLGAEKNWLLNRMRGEVRFPNF